MTKVILNGLLLLLVLLPGVSSAQWILLLSDDKTKTDWFYDAGSRNSIPRNQLWTKVEHYVPVKEMRSSRTLYEFDCYKMLSRQNMFSAYDQNNLQGKTLFSTAVPDDWEPVPPYTMHHEYYKLICEKSR